MKNLWNSVKLSLYRRSAIKKAIQEEKPEIISDFIQNYPSEENNIVAEGMSLIIVAPWHSLLVCMGLIIANSLQSLIILRELVKQDFPGWKRLDKKYIQILFHYIQEKGEKEIFSNLLHLVDIKGVELIIPHIKGSNFLEWIDFYLTNGVPVDIITDRVLDYIESIALNNEPVTYKQEELKNAYKFSMILWNHNRIEESLSILSILTIICSELIEKDILEKISDNLPQLIPQKPSKTITTRDNEISNYLNLNINDHFHPSVSYGVIRSANILSQFSSPAWIKNIKKSWILIDDLINKTSDKYQKKTLPPVLASASNALAVALGVCASCDKNYTALDTGKENIKKLEKDLQEKIKMRNELVKKHNIFVEQYQSGKGNYSKITKEILANRDEMVKLDAQIDATHAKIKGNLSAGSLLLITLSNIQTYPEIRQGAAWGLYKLAKFSYLSDSDKNEINEAIRYAVFGDPDSELQQNFSHDFRERQIYFLSGFSLLEFEQSIRDGLNWVSELVEKRQDVESSEDKSDIFMNLRWIIKLLQEHIPDILKFLCHYPLRLMTLDQHKTILGKYVRERCGITLWTRYIPPLWKRVMKSDEAGIVHERYISLDDRSKPNSMGIYYRLFEHPILVLPVIYHEYLHYEGIENESEVFIREILFMKYLIAKLAPQDDHQLPEFEERLVTSIQHVGLDGLGIQINYNIEDDSILLFLSDQIESIYGKQMDSSKAKEKAEQLIESQNISIKLENDTNEMKLNWYPEIEWPGLGTENTQDLTTEYDRILRHSFTMNHRIDSKQRDKISMDKTCQNFISAWNSYKIRTNAQKELQKMWPLSNLNNSDIVTYIVDRYSIRFVRFGNEFLGIIRNLLDEHNT